MLLRMLLLAADTVADANDEVGDDYGIASGDAASCCTADDAAT